MAGRSIRSTSRRVAVGRSRLLSSAGSRRRFVLPGFRVTMGYTLFYLCLIVLLPLLTVPIRAFSLGWVSFSRAVSNPMVIASFRVTLGTSLAAACANGVFGALVAWVLVRYEFPGRRIVD